MKTGDRKRMASRKRYDLAQYPIFFMAHIVGQNAENMSALLAHHGLNNSTWRILATLQYSDGLTVRDLSKFAVLERSFVSRLVVRLEEIGFVRRETPADDRRMTRVYLTDAGYDTFRALLLPVVEQQMQRGINGISAAEMKRFLGTLSKMMVNVYSSANLTPPPLERGFHRSSPARAPAGAGEPSN